MSNILLSIKPKYADKILSDEKKVELRRTRIKQDINKVFIYASSPVKRIVGYFTVKRKYRNTPVNIWNEYNELIGISEKDYFKHFGNASLVHVFFIDEVIKFDNPVELQEVDLKSPQSFVYLDEDVSEKILNRG